MNAPWKEAKYIHPENLKRKREEIRKEGKTIATLNGSFDLVHVGHLQIMHEASKQADYLLIALNSDNSIKKYKHSSRPFITLEHRLQLVAALQFVDFVTHFDEVDPCEILEKIQPNVHVNGSEYGDQCVEAKIVKKYGGTVHIVQLLPFCSTTHLIDKIKLCV